MAGQISYLKCLSSYIDDDKYTNLIQDIDNAAIEYEEAITNSDTSASLFAKYDNLCSLLNEHITNLERYFKNFDTDEFIKNELVIDDKINEEALHNLEKEIIKSYLYEKYLFDFYDTVSLYTKITKNELAKEGIEYENLLPQIVRKIDEDELKPVKKEVTIYVYQNGKISEKFDSTLSMFSFKVLQDTSGFNWTVKGYDVNMELMSKFKSLSAENEEEDEDSADVVLIESRTEEEKLFEEIISQIQGDDYKLSLSDFNFDDFELNLDILLDDKNNAYIQDFNLLFFILCVLVNYVRDNKEDSEDEDALEIIENKIKRVKKDIKEKLQKFGIDNIKGVFSNNGVPKVFASAINVTAELSQIFEKNESEKKDVYHSVLGDVLDSDFQLLSNPEECEWFINSNYKKIEVGASDFAVIDVKSVIKKIEHEGKTGEEINYKKKDTDNTDGTDSESVKKIQPEIESKDENKEIKIPENILNKEGEDTNTGTSSEQGEEENEDSKKNENKLSTGDIVGIAMVSAVVVGAITAGIILGKKCLNAGETNIADNRLEKDDICDDEIFYDNSFFRNVKETKLDVQDIEGSRPLTIFGVTVNGALGVLSLIKLKNLQKHLKKLEKAEKGYIKSTEKNEQIQALSDSQLDDFIEFTKEKEQLRKGIFEYFNYEKDLKEYDESKSIFSIKNRTAIAQILYAYMYYSSNSIIIEYSDMYARYMLGFNEKELNMLKEMAEQWKKNESDNTYLCLTFHSKMETTAVNDVFNYGVNYDYDDFSPEDMRQVKVPKYKGYYSIKEMSLDSYRRENKNDNSTFPKIFLDLNKDVDVEFLESYNNGLKVLPLFQYSCVSPSYVLGFSPLFFDETYDTNHASNSLYVARKAYYFYDLLTRLYPYSLSSNQEIEPIIDSLLPKENIFLPYLGKRESLKRNKAVTSAQLGYDFNAPSDFERAISSNADANDISAYNIDCVMKSRFLGMKCANLLFAQENSFF